MSGLAGYGPELARYLALRRAAPLEEVEHAGLALRLYDEEELPDAQVGYGVDADGGDLSDEAPGAWKPAWIVVGSEPLREDPLVVDLGVADFPVLVVAEEGEEWVADLVAESFPKLLAALRLVEGAGEPLAPDELDGVLGAIHRASPSASLVLWEEWLTAGEE